MVKLADSDFRATAPAKSPPAMVIQRVAQAGVKAGLSSDQASKAGVPLPCLPKRVGALRHSQARPPEYQALANLARVAGWHRRASAAGPVGSRRDAGSASLPGDATRAALSKA